MVKIEKTDVHGWEAAIRGMRNAMNSWDKSDSFPAGLFGYIVGEEDLKLMKKLSNAGPDHGKYLRMITVSCDVTAPFYWWKEYDTYKVGTTANSCSTMHKIHAKEFTLDDFSHEHLGDSAIEALEKVISVLNSSRRLFVDDNDKWFWWQMIQLLPTSYNQKRTIHLNYQVLKGMYNARKNHKLDEWHTFCDWIKSLPHSSLITGEENDNGET